MATHHENDEGQGGTIYVKSSIPQRRIPLVTEPHAIACKFKLGNVYISVCSLCYPPQQPFDGDDLDRLQRHLPGRKMILGEFNMHHIQWGSVRMKIEENQ